MTRTFFLSLACAALFTAFTVSGADARPLEAVTFGVKQKVRVDGLLREWPANLDSFPAALKGSASKGDPSVRGAVGYDDKNLYVAMKVKDGKFVRTAALGTSEDHGVLLLAFPTESGFKSYSVLLYPGETGKSPGVVKLKGGGKVAGAKLVEAPAPGGFLFEASIPWAAFPETKTVRAGLRAALRYYDADRSGSVGTIVATSVSDQPRRMPGLFLENEQGLLKSLIRRRGLSETPSRSAVGDIGGDGRKEIVAVYGGYLTIVGSGFRGGKEFFYQDLALAKGTAVTRLSLEDLTGDGKDEIVLQKKIRVEDSTREVLQVLSVSKGADEPHVAFQHEVGISTDDGDIRNEVSVGKKGVTVAQGEAKGFEPGTYSVPRPGEMSSALLPWETVKSRTFTWDGKKFVSDDEVTWDPPVKEKPRIYGSMTARPKGTSSNAAGRPSTPAPRPPSAEEMQDRLYALYRGDRRVGKSRPRFDFAVDVAADGHPERVLIHDKDIVVFGKAFKEGRSYVYITLGVEDAKDITEVTARDLTGDGKAEVVVRCILRVKASEQLGGDTVERHALFVYRVSEDGIKRIFAAETGRSVGDRSILAGIRFVPKKKGFALELHPSRAVKWTEKTYPFPVDRHPYGGLEPLILPWGDQEPQRYEFDGTAFVAK